MATLSQVHSPLEFIKSWFKRDLRFADWDRDVLVVTDTPSHCVVKLYTDIHSYSISANNLDGGYLGCIASCRKPRAGEACSRGSDLPDGKLWEGTWRHILGAIVGYELVRINVQQGALVEGSEAIV